MKHRKYFLLAVVLLVLFVVGNWCVWKMYTEDLLTTHNFSGGDLARLGYNYGSKAFRHDSFDLPRRHIHIKDYQRGKIDVITIGDSFSHGGAGGRNKFYQDYIASINNLNVLNLYRYIDVDPITTVSIMLKNGFLERFRPRYLLLSMAEKGCFELTGPVDFNRSISQEEMKYLKYHEYYRTPPELGFLNDGNLKFIMYNFLFRFSDHAYFNPVYVAKLKAPMFSVKNPDQLLYYRYTKYMDSDAVKSMNDNLNFLAEKLKQKGINLVFMPCVEKYNLYREYLVDNSYPRSSFFEDLRPLPKQYLFVDTKAILLEELKSGVKDMFYADDTHWSWKAPAKIFSLVRFPES